MSKSTKSSNTYMYLCKSLWMSKWTVGFCACFLPPKSTCDVWSFRSFTVSKLTGISLKSEKTLKQTCIYVVLLLNIVNSTSYKPIPLCMLNCSKSGSHFQKQTFFSSPPEYKSIYLRTISNTYKESIIKHLLDCHIYQHSVCDLPIFYQFQNPCNIWKWKSIK